MKATRKLDTNVSGFLYFINCLVAEPFYNLCLFKDEHVIFRNDGCFPYTSCYDASVDLKKICKPLLVSFTKTMDSELILGL